MNEYTDPDNWNKLNDTLAQFPSVVERVVTEAVKPQGAPLFEAQSITLPAGGKYMILSYNPARTRAYITGATASATGQLAIGALSNGGETGYPVPLNLTVPIEIKTIAEVWAFNKDPNESAAIAVWAEYNE